MQHYPKISIVTPSYNQGQYLEETIQSILSQNYPNLEYIIIDGGSTDNSIDIIKKYESQLTYWISEPDKGQANAINKGLEKCTGEIFNWVNSDDLLAPGSLSKVAEAFQKNIDVFGGAVEDFGIEIPKKITYNQNLTPLNMLIKKYAIMSFHQPAVWLKTEAVKQINGINENYHYCFDWDLIIRYLITFPKVAYTQSILSYFRIHEQSKTGSVPFEFQKDNLLITKKLSQQYKEFFAPYKKEINTYLKQKNFIVEVEQLKGEPLANRSKLIKLINLFMQNMNLSNLKYTLGTIKEISHVRV